MRIHRIRWLTALLVLAAFAVAYAVDWPEARDALLTTQLSPALLKLMTGAAVVVALVLSVTALFGRVYCSVACPAGTVQEAAFRVGRRLRLAKGRYKRRGFDRGSWMRPLWMLVLAAVLFSGLASLYNYFSPLGWFGRLAAPVVEASRDAALGTDDSFAYVGWTGAGFALAILLLVFAALFWGRKFCDAWCPIGWALGVVASLAPRRIGIAGSVCASCGKCEQDCPVGCIDARRKRVEWDRCVLCLSCLPACPTKAVSYGAAASSSRRGALAAALAWIGAAAFLGARAWRGKALADEGSGRVVPPGAGEAEAYARACIACQSCVAACPAGILKPSPPSMQPELRYDIGYCQYNCNQCAKACPTGALRPLPLDEKQATRIAGVELVPARCVVIIDGTSCGACAEVCPTHAVTMEDPGDGTPTRPAFYPDHCIGCGACSHVCPASPRAFEIAGLSRHERALPRREGGEGFDLDPGGDEPVDFPF